MMREMSLLISIACALGGCYLRPASANNPKSPEGIHVTLVGQECFDHLGAEGDPVSRSLSVKLRLDNPTTEPLRFETRQAELKVDDETSIPIRQSELVVVAPGESRVVDLKYLHNALCAHAFSVVLDRALTIRERPVAIAALRFLP